MDSEVPEIINPITVGELIDSLTQLVKDKVCNIQY